MLLVAVACLLPCCQDYYIQPPPVSISISAPETTLLVESIDSSGQEVVGTAQMTSVIYNTNNTNTIWSVGQNGTYVPGGDTTLGTISASGLYTAPAVAPDPNTIDIEGASQAQPNEVSITTLTLLNPTAVVTSVTPPVVVAGESYTLTIQGQLFFPGLSVEVAGAVVGAVNFISSTEITVPAKIVSSGLLNVQVQNTAAQVGGNQGFPLRSQPQSAANSAATAILIANTGTGDAPVYSTEAWVPESDSIAVVNLDATTTTGGVTEPAPAEIASVFVPTGFVPSAVAANPAQNEMIAISATTPTLQVYSVGANSLIQLQDSYPIPASGTASFSDGSTCTVCGVIVDTVRNVAILDTASGWMTMNLASGAVSTPIAAPAAENFAYNPATQQVIAPYAMASGEGVDVINLQAGASTVVQPLKTTSTQLGSAPDDASFDPGTGVTVESDGTDSLYTLLNLDNAANVTSGAVSVPASAFGVTNACAGTWNAATLELSTHLAWLGTSANCFGVIQLPTSPPTGPPGTPTTITWTTLGLGPDNIAWSNTRAGGAFSLTAYTGPDGYAYGLAVRDDGLMMLRMNLELMVGDTVLTTVTNTNVTPNVTTNQVSVLPPAGPSQPGVTTPPTIVYIPLH